MKKILFAFAVIVGVCVSARADNNCTGATYYDSNTDTCIACPNGYDYNQDAGKTDITQCQIHCDGGTYVGKYVSDGLVLHLDGFYNTRNGNDPDATTWHDLSPSQNDAMFVNTVAYDPEHYGYIFNNNSNYARTINNIGLSGAVVGTIEIVGTWYGVGSSQINGLFTFGSTGPASGLSMTGAVSGFYSVSAGMNTTTTPSTNTPFTMTYISSNGKVSGFRVKLDGEANGFVTNTTQLNVNATPLQIGRFWQYSNQNRSFNGIIHAVRVYNRVLTDEEIAQNHAIDMLRFRDGLLGYQCIDVGVGYYAPASTVNYGSVGTRTACPVGTYSNIPNASACTPCAGATYSDETGMAVCKLCPAGYDYNQDAGKTDFTQCQIHCDAGTFAERAVTAVKYVSNGLILHLDGLYNTRNGNNPNTTTWHDLSPSQNDAMFVNTVAYDPEHYGYIFNNNSNYARTINNIGLSGAVVGTIEIVGTWYGVGSSQINGLFTFGSTNATNGLSMTGAVSGFYSVNAGMNTTTTPSTNTPFTMTYISSNGKVSGFSVKLNGEANGSSTNTTQLNVSETPLQIGRFWQYSNQNRSFNGIIHAVRVYNRVLTDEEIAQNHAMDVARFSNQTFGCTNVGVGYYAPASTLNCGSVGTRTACPAGLYTVGYGHGADDANDCGRILHVGDNVIYTRRNKETTPSVNIKMDNGDMFYISLSPTDHTVSRLHFSYGGNEYTAYDDSLLYGERDFDTGQQISQ